MPFTLKKEKIVKKPYKLDLGKAFSDGRKAGYLSHFNTNNKALSQIGSEKEFTELSSILMKNLSSYASTNREGATTAVYSLLIAHGESVENILSGKVNPDIMKAVCDEIKEVGNADIAANKEGLSEEEKAAARKNLESVQDKLYKNYLNGFISMCNSYKSNIKEEFDKEPSNPQSKLHYNNMALAALITHGCTNHMQDPAFVERMNNTYDKVEQKYQGEKVTDINKLYDGIAEELSETLIYKDSLVGLELLDTPESERINNTVLFNIYVKNRAMANTKFDTFLDRMAYYNTVQPSEDFEFSEDIDFDMAWTLHIKNMFKEGTVLSDIKPTELSEDIYSQVPAEKIEKLHKEYVKKQFYKDVMNEFNNSIKRDINGNTLTEQELDKGLDDPDVKAKIEAPPVASHTQTIIQKSYGEFLKQLKNTSEINKEGQLTGNSPIFMDMYNKIKDVSEMDPKSKDFMAKYEESQKAIDAYVNKRDGFLKIRSYGRERINIAKQMQTMNNSITDKLKKTNEFIADSKRETKKFLYHDEKISVNELSEGGTAKPKDSLTKVNEKDMSKQSKESVLGG